MSAPRFLVPGPLAAGTPIVLPPAAAHHALRVLRLRDGDAITLFDGSGGEHAATLRLDGEVARADSLRFEPVEREAPLSITLIQALVATDKLDWIVEKATELGAAAMVLAPCERSVVRLQAERAARRLAHLREVIASACAQCGRNRVPTVTLASSLASALQGATAAARFVLTPHGAQGLNAPAGTRTAALAVGPEGGFSEAELALARHCGYTPAHLGPRVLRTETAGLAALAALQATAGDLAPAAPGAQVV